MKIINLRQAPCNDRNQPTVGPNPNEWLEPALPEGWQTFTFQYFVQWNHTPPTVGRTILLSQLVILEPGEEVLNITDQDLLKQFNESGTRTEWNALQNCLGRYGKNVVPVLLPEVALLSITDETPFWSVKSDQAAGTEITKSNVRDLKKAIRRHRGGAATIGSKGLTFGTSAIECHLSHTEDIFPGDADAVIVDENRIVKHIIEYKKHTVAQPIANHLVTRYYPSRDGRKYQAIQALASDLNEEQTGHIPMTVFYFTNKPPYTTRLQEITHIDKTAIGIGDDTGDLPAAEISAEIRKWLKPHSDESV